MITFKGVKVNILLIYKSIRNYMKLSASSTNLKKYKNL